jgi:predicted phage tail protein
MQRKIRLYGRLKKRFGPEFCLDVSSPLDAVRALILMVPGFAEELKEGNYKIVRGNRQTGLYLDIETVALELGNTREVHLIPTTAHAKSGFGKILAGVALIGIAIATGGAAIPAIGLGATAGTATAFGGLVIGTGLGIMATSIGVMLALGGISMLLAPKPKATKAADSSKDGSFLFGGAQNTADQGIAVPIVYGRVKAGSVVVSAGLDVEQMAVGPSLIQVLTDASGATTSTTEDGTGSGTYSEGTWREDP